MDELLLKDYLKTNDIWAAIQALEDFSFIGSSDDMNLQLSVDYGQRIMFNSIAELTTEQVAKMIVATRSNKWTGLILFSESAIDIGAEFTDFKTGTALTDQDQSQTTNDVNKVSAYNSTDLIIDGGSDSDVTSDLNKTVTTQEEQKRVSLKNVYDNLNLTDKTNIISVVQKDVALYLTLDIYKS